MFMYSIKGLISKLIFAILLAMFLGACSQNKRILLKNEIDKEKVRIAHTFTEDFFMKSKTGDTIDFENRVSEQMKNVFNKKEQFPLYNQFKEQIGEYKHSQLEEAWEVNGIKKYTVYRFKANFEGQDEKQEIRVVIDTTNLVAAYYVGKWKDTY